MSLGFHISAAKLMLTEAYLGSYQIFMTELFTKFAQIWVNQLSFLKIYWKFAHWSLRRYLIKIWNCYVVGFMIELSSIIQTLHVVYLITKNFFLALCNDLVHVAWIEHKETSLIIPVSLFFDIIDVVLSITLQDDKFVFTGITFTCA